jgi:hypothetical protein
LTDRDSEEEENMGEEGVAGEDEDEKDEEGNEGEGNEEGYVEDEPISMITWRKV